MDDLLIGMPAQPNHNKTNRKTIINLRNKLYIPFKNALKMKLMLASGYLSKYRELALHIRHSKNNITKNPNISPKKTIRLRTVDGSLLQKSSRHMLQESSQAFWMPPSTNAAADDR